MQKCDKISKIMHDNFFKEREFALDVIEIKEENKQEESNIKQKNDMSLKFNVIFFYLIFSFYSRRLTTKKSKKFISP